MTHKISITELKESLNGQDEYMPYKLNINSSVDAFLKIRETLTRVGRLQTNSKNGKESLWQVCHIVQDEATGACYLVHFKHLYLLSGMDDKTEFNQQDFAQLTYIASLLEKWGLSTYDEQLVDVNTRCNISIIPFSRKKEVLLRKKFYIRKDTV
jgi:hypothetical protein